MASHSRVVRGTPALVLVVLLLSSTAPGVAQGDFVSEARALKARGDVDGAIARLQQGLAHNPDNASAHYVLGWLYAGKGDQTKAAAAFRRVVELSPDTDEGREAKAALERLEAEEAPKPGGPGKASPVPPTSVELWDEVDIVPMPKHMRLTGSDLPLSGAVLVLGNTPCRQSEIGAEWINRRITELGGEALEVVSQDSVPGDGPAIIIGTREDNGLIEQVAEQAIADVAPDNPGPQGYEIRSPANGQRTYLAGADSIGALYACVTFAELIGGKGDKIVWREAEVRDWPDFLHRPLGGMWTATTAVPEIHRLKVNAFRSKPTPEVRDEFLQAMRAHYDRLLRWKVSYFQLAGQWWWYRDTSPENRALVREAIEYGKERGIGFLLFPAQPFVALAEDHPQVERKCLPTTGSLPWQEWIRCWSMDELRQETAQQLAEFVKDIGATDVCFHDTDTGGYSNPAQWNQRCDVCRQRWGDDYAAATTHKHRIYYDALREAVPDLRIHFTLYPYYNTILDPGLETRPPTWYEMYVPEQYDPANRTRHEEFLRRVARELPPDVTFDWREDKPAVIERVRQLTRPHAFFAYFAMFGNHAWRGFFNETPRWIGTMYEGPRDFLFLESIETFVPLRALGALEYAWNTQAPGATPFARQMECDQWRHSEPRGEIYAVVLPHILRNLFGREAASEITRAVSPNIDPRHIFGTMDQSAPRRLIRAGDWQQQADRAAAGVAALDSVWEECRESGTRLAMNDYTFRRFVYLREALHGCRWMATARAEDLRARELAAEQDMVGAEAAVERGLAAVTEGKADTARLLGERPQDPVFDTPGINAWADSWREFMADRVGLTPAEEALKQTRTDLPKLGPVPDPTLDRLIGRRMLRAVRATAPVVVDGSPREPQWDGAYPIEAFLVEGQERRVALALTRARFLYDQTHLYMALSCRPPGERASRAGVALQRGIQPEDTVEVILHQQSWGDDLLYIGADAAGRITCQSGRMVPEGNDLRWQPHAGWTCAGLLARATAGKERWDIEVAIPWSSLGVAGPDSTWRANCYRGWPRGDGSIERSSTRTPQAGRLYDPAALRPVVWCEGDTYEPSVSVDVVEAELGNSVAIGDEAAAVEFGVEIEASQVLHNVRLQAEVYGPDGQLLAQRQVLERDRVSYRWQPSERCHIGLPEPCDRAGIQLTLESDEVRCGRWLRFGGWQGDVGIGTLFRVEPDATAGPADFRATPSLRDAAHFPSVARLPDGGQSKLFEAPAGTVEFWVRPEWQAAWPAGGQRSEHDRLTHGLFHFGVLWPSRPQLTHYDSVSLVHYALDGTLNYHVASYHHVGWTSTAEVCRDIDWQAGTWHHLACVWDATAEPEGWLRIYIDGKAQGTPTQVSHPEQWPNEDKSPRVRNDAPFVVQIGCLNSGRFPANACSDELRISRTARYDGNFTPETRELALDQDTTALFHFNGNLSGEGVAPDGTRYAIEATAGVVEYR